MFNRKLIVVLIVVALIPTILIVWWFHWRWSANSLIISRATTYIEEPLRADGYPDYITALNERMSEGVTPENNAAVLLLRAMGPKEIDDELRSEFFKQLGVRPLPEAGNYFVGWPVYFRSIPPADAPQRPSGSLTTIDDLFDEMWEHAMERPWSGEEFPHLAKWLDANAPQLEMFVAASKQPRFYAPALSSGNPPTLYSTSLPLLQMSRWAAQTLVIRAMLNLRQWHVEVAWDDLMACRRLGRLTGQGGFLLDLLVCYAIEGIAVEGQKQVLAEGKLTAEQCAAMQKQLDELPPLPSSASHFDLGERFGMLDGILTVAREGPQAAELSGGTGNNPLGDFTMRGGDWNVALRMVNELMDRYVAAAGIEDPKVRDEQIARIEADLKEMATDLRETNAVSSLFSRDQASERNAKTLLAQLFPAISAVFQAESRTKTNQDLLRIGVALAQYKAESGKYPEKIEMLVPKYLAVLPSDSFAGTPFVYKKRADGYLLYSVGANQVDDGGKSYDEDKDDLVMQIPRPAPKKASPSASEADAPSEAAAIE